MYENVVYICIFWYSKIYWYPVKKCWCQQNSRHVSRGSYIFWIFFGKGITVPRFVVVGYVWQILGRGSYFVSSIREQARKGPFWKELKGLLENWLHFSCKYKGNHMHREKSKREKEISKKVWISTDQKEHF